MKDISKSFGNTQALKDVHFELRNKEIHGLLGENGAGKSTLIKVLGGIHKPDAGEIKINNQIVEINKVHEAQKMGIGIIHQEIVLVPYLTVAENIFLGREPVSRLGFKDIRRMNVEARKMLQQIGVSICPTAIVDTLTIAQQQLIEIIKAISFEVKVLVMDEPTSSLSEEEVGHLFVIMERLKEKGVSIIYISHKFEELFKMTDRITVIRDGCYVATVPTKDTNTDELVSMMVGRELKNFYTRTDSVQDEELLKVENLTRNGVFEDCSFVVRRGEIVGFAGLVGAGRSELMQAICGNDAYDKGRVFLGNKEVKFRNCMEAIKEGIVMVPEDRKRQGLVLNNSVSFNIALPNLNKVMSNNKLLVSEGKKEDLARESIKKMDIKTSSHASEVNSLSGGNQQKVVLGKWLATTPRLLILDEPTRGIDVNAKSEIYAKINQLANEGVGIILVSSELLEIINMSDSVCVMRNGKISGVLSKSELSQENIMSYATGG